MDHVLINECFLTLDILGIEVSNIPGILEVVEIRFCMSSGIVMSQGSPGAGCHPDY